MPAKISHIQVSDVVGPAPTTMSGLPSVRGVIALVEVDGMPHLPRPTHPSPRACPCPGIPETCPSGEDTLLFLLTRSTGATAVR
jgi:hypothetical protein